MKKILLVALIVLVNYYFGFSQSFSQTRTATFLNNLNQFQQVFGDQNYPRAKASDVALDDNVFTRSSKLIGIKDSLSSFTSRSVSSLALQGFGFTIPTNATVQSISIRLKRFKTGTPSVGDHILSLMQRYQAQQGLPARYGVHWTYRDSYAAKIYPQIETQYTFSQSGSANNGGFFHNEAYQWTPAVVNSQLFGVRIDNYVPIGNGSVVISYDLVEVSVQYTLPTASSSHLENSLVTNRLEAPTVTPNPFRTITNIKFTASEDGDAMVVIYTLLGTKVRTVFSGKVVHGRIYTVNATGAYLTKGMYLYMVTNGKQRYTGRLLKIE
jgi:hypothetical protein